jgi:hypothetical protein
MMCMYAVLSAAAITQGFCQSFCYTEFLLHKSRDKIHRCAITHTPRLLLLTPALPF